MQELILFLIFIAAVAYLGRRAFQSLGRKDTGGCGKDCGCSTDVKVTTVKSTKARL